MLEMTANDIGLEDILIDRIAKLVTMEVPQKQIAAATGVSVNKISKVVANSKVVAKVQQLAIANLEQQDLVNQGWDVVEEEGLGTVLESLRANPDPEFALKAAAVANKAQRRGSANEAIAGNTKVTAVIELSAVFIDKLQMMSIGMDEISKNAKRIDTLGVQQTQNLFRDTGENPLDDLFGKDDIIDGE